jgi:hypothetical protein
VKDQVLRTGDRTGDVLTAEHATLQQENKAREKAEPGWMKRLAEATEAHHDRKARRAEREAEHQRQKAEQREACSARQPYGPPSRGGERLRSWRK